MVIVDYSFLICCQFNTTDVQHRPQGSSGQSRLPLECWQSTTAVASLPPPRPAKTNTTPTLRGDGGCRTGLSSSLLSSADPQPPPGTGHGPHLLPAPAAFLPADLTHTWRRRRRRPGPASRAARRSGLRRGEGGPAPARPEHRPPPGPRPPSPPGSPARPCSSRRRRAPCSGRWCRGGRPPRGRSGRAARRRAGARRPRPARRWAPCPSWRRRAGRSAWSRCAAPATAASSRYTHTPPPVSPGHPHGQRAHTQPGRPDDRIARPRRADPPSRAGKRQRRRPPAERRGSGHRLTAPPAPPPPPPPSCSTGGGAAPAGRRPLGHFREGRAAPGLRLGRHLWGAGPPPRLPRPPAGASHGQRPGAPSLGPPLSPRARRSGYGSPPGWGGAGLVPHGAVEDCWAPCGMRRPRLWWIRCN